MAETDCEKLERLLQAANSRLDRIERLLAAQGCVAPRDGVAQRILRVLVGGDR